ncbi:MAG: hypothetical protein ACXWLR_12990, partial [Myxococcales bacterium]
RWLGSSLYARPAADLQEELRSAAKTEGRRRPLSDLARESLQLKREFSQERVRLEFLRKANTYEYNARMDDHNRRVRAGVALFRRYRTRARELARVEVAFNRCLDPKILFTRFSRVDIRAATTFEDDEDSASP